MGKERVSGGTPLNSFDEYLIAQEQAKIDKRLKQALAECDDLYEVLKRIEKMVRQSTNYYDKIYRYRYIDNYTVTEVTNRVEYSRSTVWHKLNEIKKHI